MSPVARQGGAPEAPFKVTLRQRVSSRGPQLSQQCERVRILGPSAESRDAPPPRPASSLGLGWRNSNSATVWPQGALQELCLPGARGGRLGLLGAAGRQRLPCSWRCEKGVTSQGFPAPVLHLSSRLEGRLRVLHSQVAVLGLGPRPWAPSTFPV